MSVIRMTKTAERRFVADVTRLEGLATALEAKIAVANKANTELAEQVAIYNSHMENIMEDTERFTENTETAYAKKNLQWRESDYGDAVHTWIVAMKEFTSGMALLDWDAPPELGFIRPDFSRPDDAPEEEKDA